LVEQETSKARISEARHAVIRGATFIGFGKRPSRSPAHQVVFQLGGEPAPAAIATGRRKSAARLSYSVAIEVPNGHWDRNFEREFSMQSTSKTD
jgi:hypothetical protein